MSAHLKTLLTNADLEAMPYDGNTYELIEGELHVSRAPDIIHQRVLTKILVAFATYLDQCPIGEVLPGPGVIFGDHDGVIPDLVYLSNERRAEVATGARIYGPPNLVVEILSPGSANIKRDREIKLKLYAKFGVEEYWIVDTRERAVEVYRREDERLRFFTTFVSDETMTTPLLPDFGLTVRSLF